MLNDRYLTVVMDEITRYFKTFNGRDGARDRASDSARAGASDSDSDSVCVSDDVRERPERPLTENEISQFFQRNDVTTAMSDVITEVKKIVINEFPIETLEEYTLDKETFRDLIFDGPLIQLMNNYDMFYQNQGRKIPLYRFFPRIR
jgi:hypothetical protein